VSAACQTGAPFVVGVKYVLVAVEPEAVGAKNAKVLFAVLSNVTAAALFIVIAIFLSKVPINLAAVNHP
jgi:hypothetical protein